MSLSFSEIIKLDGKSTNLYSSHSNKNLIMDTLSKKIFFDNRSFTKDNEWNFIPIENEDEHVYFRNKYFYICHFPDDNGNISLLTNEELSDNEEFCKWKIGSSGELYHLSDNEEKYLWVANNNLHIISDGYLADRWSTKPQKNTITQTSSSKGKNNILKYNVIIILVFISIIFVTFFFIKRL
jgi:hypothetical protein